MKLEAISALIPFDAYTQSAYAQEDLGAIIKCADARWFRHGVDSGSGNHKGYMQVSPVIVADGQNMTVLATAAIGDTRVKVTYGTTALTAGVYDEGYMIVNAGVGLGQIFKIRNSSAVTASATTDPNGTAYGLILDLYEPLVVALDTTSKVSIVHNTYNGTREATGSTLRPAGVPMYTCTASYYYWAQVRGVAAVLASSVGGTTGYAAANSASTTAGAVENAGTQGQVVDVGYFLYTAATAEYRPVFLTIN